MTTAGQISPMRQKLDGQASAPVIAEQSVKLLGMAGPLRIQRHQAIEQLKQEWLALEKDQTASIYQHYEWVRIALETINATGETFIVTGRSGNKLQFILPMVLQKGMVSELGWIGGSHANVCSGLYSEAFLKSAPPEIMRDVFDLIGQNISGMAMTRLGNQPCDLKGYPNPMAITARQKSVNSLFEMDLSGGFDAVLEAGNAKRKRKIFRRQERIAAENGGYELVVPETPHDIQQAIGEFRAFKEVRFREMGIHDVFAPQPAREFLDRLGAAPLSGDVQPFRIYQLKIGGKTRAVYAGGVIGDCYQAAVNGISIDELTHESPGEFLLYLMVADLIEKGFQKLDLGVGDERYKRSWCQNQHELFDVIQPLSMMAIPFAALFRLKQSAKGRLRNNKTAWQFIKKIRRITGPQKN